MLYFPWKNLQLPFPRNFWKKNKKKFQKGTPLLEVYTINPLMWSQCRICNLLPVHYFWSLLGSKSNHSGAAAQRSLGKKR